MKSIEGRIVETYKMDNGKINYIIQTKINGVDIYWTIDDSFYYGIDGTHFGGENIQVL